MDIRAYNRAAWDRQVTENNPWTVPVSADVVQAGRQGRWSVLLTPSKPVPASWFPPISGMDLLGLACGGGQQGPIFAAAGANVTIFDNSPRQLGQDRRVAERENLTIHLVEGDMRDLSAFPDASFDLVFHPVSNVFCPEVLPVWKEAARVLRPTGRLLAGFANPDLYIFDLMAIEDNGVLAVRHRLPYADAKDLTAPELEEIFAEGRPLEYSHTLEEQIGGQIEAGLVVTGFYEDRYPLENEDLPSIYFPTFFATLSIKN